MLDSKIIDLLKEISFVNLDANSMERAEVAMKAQAILKENGHSEWVEKEIQANIDYIMED